MSDFTRMVLLQRENQIFTLQARDYTGRKAWYKLHVAPARHEAFMQAFTHNLSCNLTAFGTVLDSGYGDSPE